MKHFRIFLLLLGVLTLSANPQKSRAQVYNFTTIAGNAGYGSADGTNGDARFYQPGGLAIGTNGSFYVADTANQTIREIKPVGPNWVVTTIAGWPRIAGGTDGTNASARFNGPIGIAADLIGNLFVADSVNSTVRKLTPVGTNWVVTTIAGLAQVVGSNDGTNSDARFKGPAGIWVGTNGVVYVSDNQNYTVRSITPSGTNWIVNTIAGLAGWPAHTDGTNSDARFYGPAGLIMDANGTLYMSDRTDGTIRKLVPSGTNWIVTTIAGVSFGSGYHDGTNSDARFSVASGMALGPGGELYIADRNNSVIRKLAPSGTNWISSTLVGQAGVYSYADGTNSDARFYLPTSVVRDAAGKLYIGDTFNHLIRRMTASGTNWVVDTIAGQMGGPGTKDSTNSLARFYEPVGIAMDTNGSLYLGDFFNNSIRKLTRSGADWISSTIAGVSGIAGHTDGTNNVALFSHPEGVAMDQGGNLYVADLVNSTIRKLTPSGTNWVTSTIAGTNGVAAEADGTNALARFNQPFGIAVGTNGNVFVADVIGRTIRKLTPSGTNWVVTTIAGTALTSAHVDGTNNNALFGAPFGIAAGGDGSLFVTDADNTIRKVTPMGTNWVTTTIAGKAATAGSADGINTNALFNTPIGIAVDATGRVFVTEDGGWTIRLLTPVGTNWVVTTVGGIPNSQGTDDGLTGEARFYRPQGILVTSSGTLFITDTYNSTVREGVPVGPAAPPAPVFQSVGRTGGTVTFTWSAGVGSTYQLQYSTNLAQTNWSNLGGQVLGTNVMMVGTDAGGTDARRFYRVLLLP